MECAAIQDVLVVGKSLDENESRDRKVELDRIAAMLSRLGKRGYAVEEEPSNYGIDPDLLRHLRLAPSIAISIPMKVYPNQTLHSTRTSRVSELDVRKEIFRLEPDPIYGNLSDVSAITELKALSVPERLQLVEDLWDSIASDQTALPDHPQAVEEVRLRRARFEGESSSGLSWDQLKRKIRSGYGYNRGLSSGG